MNQETANNFFDAMDTIARDEAARLARDKTIEANIVRVNNVDIGEYTVEEGGSNYIAYSEIPDVRFHVGDYVYVLIPQADYNLRKIIRGLSKSNMSAADIANLSQIPVPRGPNWISRANTPDDAGLYHYNVPTPPNYPTVGENSANGIDPSYKIYSWPLHITVGISQPGIPVPAWDGNGAVYYDDSWPWFTDVGFAANINSEAANDAIFQTYAKLYDKVLIRAKFKTLFASQHVEGRYMLVAVCEENIKNTAGVVVERRWKTLELGYTSFVGNPYAYNEWAAQEAILTVSPDSLIGLRAVYLTQNWGTGPNVPAWQVDYRTDYDAAGNPTQVYNTTVPNVICDDIWISFCEIVDFGEEIYRLFINTPKGWDLIPGLAPLPLKGSLLYKGEEILDISTSVCYWYKENFYIQFGSSQFDKLGGARWEVIGGAKYNEIFGQIEVPRWANPPTNSIEEVPWQWRYKLVVVYNDKITLSETQTIINSNAANEYSLVCWTSDDNTVTYLQVYINGVIDWWHHCDWWVELEDGSYQLITTGGRWAGALSVNAWMHNPMARFYCAVSSNTSDNTRPADPNSDIVANLEYQFTEALEESDLFVEWVGQDLYTYDAQGNFKTFGGLENSRTERTLYAKLLWAPEKLAAYRIEIIAPDGTVMTPRAANSEGYDPANSMMYHTWLGNFIEANRNPNQNNNVIHYHISEKYADEKRSNTWILRVHTAANKTYDFPKVIQFVKDGAQGTNGGQYNVQLWPIRGKVAPANATTKLEDPQPLRYYYGWTVNDDWRLYLRPFVTRNNTPIESIPGVEYWVHYSVQREQQSPNAGTSLLRLYDYASGNLIGMTASNVPWNATYGAIEVRGELDPGSYDNGSRFAFVSCQVDVYEDGSLVSTIYSAYPVDIYEGSNTVINKAGLKTNWPRFVMYNSIGYDPQVFDEPMYFNYFSETAAQGGTNVGASYDPQTFWPTDYVHEILVNPANRGQGYWYRPNDYFWWKWGHTGVLRTTTTAAPLNGAYYRTVWFYLNAFGNVDINGWDGTGIDIDEGNGTLFAPTIGAGYKEPASNKFTGVIMGIDKSQPIEVNGANGAPNLFAGINAAAYKSSHPYQVGLFGYQTGIASFGLLENGTAFFGRADRGGRIVIDGINGTIYGGYSGNGSNWHQGANPIGWSMKNRMRLTLADLYVSGERNGSQSYNVDGDILNFNTQYFDPSTYPSWYRDFIYRWNSYGSPDATNAIYTPDPTGATQFTGTPNANAPATGMRVEVDNGVQFGAGNAQISSTPAIEIGEHPPNARPPIIPASWLLTIMSNFKIPGNRNFLVTYDGTLWAQNGFFQGNVIASNVLASNIVSLSGIMNPDGTQGWGRGTTWNASDGTISWSNFSLEGPVWNSNPRHFHEYGTWIDTDGVMWVREIHIGGPGNNTSTIEIGDLHIASDGVLIGDYGAGGPSRLSVVGETNLWGDVGLVGTYSNKLVAVGEIFLGSPDVAGAIGNANHQNSMMSIVDRTATTGEGYFHPMHFHIGAIMSGQDNNWMTTMDAYMSSGMIPLVYSSISGSSFFRVGGAYGVLAKTIGFVGTTLSEEAPSVLPKALMGDLTSMTIEGNSGYGFATDATQGAIFMGGQFVKIAAKTGSIYMASKSNDGGTPTATGSMQLRDLDNRSFALGGTGHGVVGSAAGAMTPDIAIKNGVWFETDSVQIGAADSARHVGSVKAGMSVNTTELDIGVGAGGAAGPPIGFTAGMHVGADDLNLVAKTLNIIAAGSIHATPGKAIILTETDIEFKNYDAENQKGIYARFG